MQYDNLERKRRSEATSEQRQYVRNRIMGEKKKQDVASGLDSFASTATVWDSCIKYGNISLALVPVAEPSKA